MSTPILQLNIRGLNHNYIPGLQPLINSENQDIISIQETKLANNIFKILRHGNRRLSKPNRTEIWIRTAAELLITDTQASKNGAFFIATKKKSRKKREKEKDE